MSATVVRRSLIATAAFLAGNLFHFGLVLTANRLIEPVAFGRFFASMSLLDILLVPATGLSFVLARHFTATFPRGGARLVSAEATRLLRQHLLPGAGLAAVAGLALGAFGWSVGAEGLWLAAVVPLTALAVYCLQLLRAAFQGLLDFHWYNTSWVASRAAQYALAVAGLLAIGTVWAGILGILVATLAVALVLIRQLQRRAGRGGRTAMSTAPPFRLAGALPFMLEFGAFVLLANLDVLLAYVVLEGGDLGTYAASAFLPKAIVVAVLPVTQVMLPILTAAGGSHAVHRRALAKAIAVTAGLATAGAAVLWLGNDIICDPRLAVRFCGPDLMGILALAAIPLSLLRLLIVARLALGRRGRLLLPFGVALSAAAVMITCPRTPAGLASAYAAACWAVPIGYGLASAALSRRWRIGAPKSGGGAEATPSSPPATVP